MTEQERIDALNFAYCFNPLKDPNEILTEEKRFIAAARLFFRNYKDLKKSAWFLSNGFEYVSTSSEDLSDCIAAMANPIIPKCARDEIEQQRLEWIEKRKHKNEEARRNRPSFAAKVYLMRNLRNGFTKIGFSKNPKAREATLQSQEPEIEIINTWTGTQEDEINLHKLHSHLRVRGEWFKLSDDDVVAIGKIMEGQP